MFGQRFGRLAIQRRLGDFFQLVERAGVEVEERRPGRGVGVQPCEARGSPGLEKAGGLDGRELSERPSHGGRGQWRGRELL